MTRRIHHINMLGAERNGCTVTERDGTASTGDATWFVRCECGTIHSERGNSLRNGSGVWHCTTCRRPAGPAIGSTVKTWRIVAAPRIRHVTAECIHCGATRTMRTDGISSWHRGCSVPNPQRGWRVASEGGKYAKAGDHPCWPQWSAELHMDPTLRAVWPLAKVQGVDAWRSNQAAATMTWTADDWALSRRVVG